MWKISDTLWLNPLAIAYVRDTPAADTIKLYFCGDGNVPLYMTCYKQERQALLAFLGQHTTMHPPYLMPDDDEPPF